MNDVNPTMETFENEDGGEIRLEELISNEVKSLSIEYLYKYGVTPPEKLILNWMQRLKRSYFKCELVTVEMKI